MHSHADQVLPVIARDDPGEHRDRRQPQESLGEVKSTLIHELTHAIGCSGHFFRPSYRRRSVMYEANTLTAWSQDDAAVIRLLYSTWIRPGMSAAHAEASLRRYGRCGLSSRNDARCRSPRPAG